ncbi:hypothetical protein [Paludibacter sp. 221]|nr:hypothetical protein [Paludibacter sp. 221]
MKAFIYWLFDKLLSDPLNERICLAILAPIGAYLIYLLIRLSII